MRQPKQIPRQAELAPSRDYAHLRAQGIAHCQTLASAQWTDYNEHDPGVTILEQLCYALTELGYRTNFPVEDILASRPSTAGKPLPDTLFTGDRILTCSPLTTDDYRRLLYAEVSGVRNVWLEPAADHPLGVAGLYRVLVETYGFSADEAHRENIRAKVEALMRRNRNLCEDVDSVEILRPFPLQVEATLVMRVGPSPAEVLATALFSVQEGLVAYPRVKPIVESLAAEVPPDEIFLGPRLSVGGLEHQQQTALPSEISVQSVRRLLMAVPGVRQVRSLTVNGQTQGSVKLDPYTVPRLEPSIYQPQRSYPIRLETDSGQPQTVDANGVWRLIQRQIDELKNREAYALRSMRESDYVKPPHGQARDIASYYSVQHQFPVTYGLGRQGVVERFGGFELLSEELDARAIAWEEDGGARTTERWAQSRQLKAYLLLFEQLLADYLAQLSRVADLFGLDRTLDRSYFCQPIVHFPPREADPPDAADVLITPHEPKEPRNRFRVCILDDRPASHGAAPEEILLMSREVGGTDEAWRVLDEILHRGQFPAHFAAETSHHGDTRLLLLDGRNQPLAFGEERFISIAKAHEGRTYLTRFLARLAAQRVLRDRYIKHVSPIGSIGVRVIDEMARVVLSSYDLATQEARRHREDQILLHGVRPERYQVKDHPNGEFSVLLCDADQQRVIAFGGRRFASKEEAHKEILELVRRLEAINRDEALRRRHVQRLPDASSLMPDDGLAPADRQVRSRVRAYQQALDKIVKDPEPNFLHRRNRFLDHLLARFSERFDSAALSFYDPRPYGERDEFYRELVQWKVDFLQHYVALSGERGKGFDYTGATAPHNVSGLERRLHLLLGFQGQRDAPEGGMAGKPLAAEPHPFAYVEAHTDVDSEPLFQRYARSGFFFSCAEPGIFQELVGRGTTRDNFTVELHRPTGHWHVHFDAPHGVRYAVHEAESEAEAWAAIDLLLRYVHEHARHGKNVHAGEGLYILEHVLLRPAAADHWAGQVLPLAGASSNYDIEITGEDEMGRSVRLALCRDDERRTPIAHYRHLFYTVDEANEWRRHLAAQIERASGQAAYLQRYAQLFLRLSGALLGPHPADAFYSHRISVLFSGWPIRCQSPGFRAFAEEVVRENCPAHIAAQCFWLGHREMHEFETLHAAWSEAKAAAESRAAEAARRTVDRLATGLKHYIEWLDVRRTGASGETAAMPSELVALLRELEARRTPPGAR